MSQEAEVLVLPDSVPLRTAAALPEAWGTAYQILHFVGGVRKGDTVLVRANVTSGRAARLLSSAAELAPLMRHAPYPMCHVQCVPCADPCCW